MLLLSHSSKLLVLQTSETHLSFLNLLKIVVILNKGDTVVLLPVFVCSVSVQDSSCLRSWGTLGPAVEKQKWKHTWHCFSLWKCSLYSKRCIHLIQKGGHLCGDLIFVMYELLWDSLYLNKTYDYGSKKNDILLLERLTRGPFPPPPTKNNWKPWALDAK
jgi:hypothetical protein